MTFKNPPANTKWQKGQSGNPSGRKPYKHIRGAICEMFSAPAINKQGNTIDDKCNLDILLNNLLLKSVKGDMRATEILLSYGYGKPTNMIEIEQPQISQENTKTAMDYMEEFISYLDKDSLEKFIANLSKKEKLE
jgi:hypothetical protein